MNKTLSSVLENEGVDSDVSTPELTRLDLQTSLSNTSGASLSSGPIMLQSLGQLVYTSFPKIGFRHLSSAQIPKEIQHAFVHQVVYLRWNSYNPPAADYRAAYLYQINTDHTLFGWLYGDATDDVGRHVPYFIGYHLAEPLTSTHLDNIFVCLQRGPISLVNKHDLGSSTLENLSIPDVRGYPPAHIGVDIPDDIRNYSRTFLQMQELLNIFVPASDRQSRQATRKQETHQDSARQGEAAVVLPSMSTEEVSIQPQNPVPAKTDTFEQILYDLIAKPIGVQSAFLVSLEGQPITAPIGISENSALIIAGTMLYLARSTNEELQWQGIEKISVQAKEGFVILASCTPNVYLLVKTAKALSGLLDGEINRTVERLQIALQTPDIIDKDTELTPEARNEFIAQLNLDEPVANHPEP